MLNFLDLSHTSRLLLLHDLFDLCERVPDTENYFKHQLGSLPHPDSFLHALTNHPLGQTFGLSYNSMGEALIDGVHIASTSRMCYPDYVSVGIFWIERPDSPKQRHLLRLAALYDMELRARHGAGMFNYDMILEFTSIHKYRLEQDIFPRLVRKGPSKMRIAFDTEAQC